QEWNSHKIRYNIYSKCPPGCPNDIYFLPELNNTQDYRFKVNLEEYQFIYNKYYSNSDWNNYFSKEIILELNMIVSKILLNLEQKEINIVNSRKIYNILRNFRYQNYN
ncbi:13605_t:CDS:1, partial [Gigaspora margarita]